MRLDFLSCDPWLRRLRELPDVLLEQARALGALAFAIEIERCRRAALTARERLREACERARLKILPKIGPGKS
jgi:hypothetical protein